MRAFISILLISTIAGAYAFGRWQRPEPIAVQELATLDSFRSAFDQPDVLERSYRFHSFLQTMGPADVEQAAKTIEMFNAWLVADELQNFMIVWASFDPRGALDWGLTRSRSFRTQAAGAAIGGWAFHNPDAARQAFEGLDPISAPPALEEHLIAGWLSGGRDAGVAEYIATRTSGIERQRYTNLLTIGIMRDGPAAVMRWAEGVEEDAADSYKYTAFQKAANIVAAVDPPLAAEWVELHLDEDYAEGLPGVVTQRWMDVDPASALEWLASLPTEDHGEALKIALLGWLNQSPEAAEAWLVEATPESGLDVGVELMLARSGDDMQASIDWAQRLAAPVARNRSVVRIGRIWLRREPEAARTWLAESTLSPSVKNAILNPNMAEPRTQRPPKAQALPGGAAREAGSQG